MINRHGLKINGLKNAAHNTIHCCWDGCRTQISYDVNSGNLYTNDHIGQSWTMYHDPAIITVCFATKRMTMQEIADAVYAAVRNRSLVDHI